jgi:transcriptional regulator with XRE-family HTH domain
MNTVGRSNQGDRFVDRIEEEAAAGAAARAGPRPVPSAIRAEPEPATIGVELRAARARAGLSLDAVAERTKVRPGVLRLIEDDAHDRLPALTYTLGFVKAYARTVGLDAAAAAERYRRESQKGEPVPAVIDLKPLDAQRRPSSRLVWRSAGLVLLALLVPAASHLEPIVLAALTSAALVVVAIWETLSLRDTRAALRGH